MLKKMYELFVPPQPKTPDELASKQLHDARMGLLHWQEQLEIATANVAVNSARIQRLAQKSAAVCAIKP